MIKKKLNKVKLISKDAPEVKPKSRILAEAIGSRRAYLRSIGPRNNDGTFKNSQRRPTMNVWNDQVIYLPPRKKLKGYQKEARRS